MTGTRFPRLDARDLDGRQVALPAELPAIGMSSSSLSAAGSMTRSTHGSWLQEPAAAITGLGFVEVPAIGLQWQCWSVKKEQSSASARRAILTRILPRAS